MNQHRSWTTTEQALLKKLFVQGLTDCEIAARMTGRTIESVSSKRRQMRLSHYSASDGPNEIAKRVRRLMKVGKTASEISKVTNRSVITIAKIMQKLRRGERPDKDISALPPRLQFDGRDTEADAAWHLVLTDYSGAPKRDGVKCKGSIRDLDDTMQVIRLLTPEERIGYLQKVIDFVAMLESEK